MKKCAKCKISKDLSEFSFKNKAKSLFQSYCKECARLFIKNHYNNNKVYYLKKAKDRNLSTRFEVMKYINVYLQNKPCIDCGETDIAVLEFDHIDRSLKFKAISTLIRYRYPLEVVKKEVEKCEVRCANCHRRKTAIDFKWFKTS